VTPRHRRAVQAVKQAGDNPAIKWVLALTPLVVAVISMKQSGQAKQDTAVTAASVVMVQHDQIGDAASRQRLRVRVALLEDRIARLEQMSGRRAKMRDGDVGGTYAAAAPVNPSPTLSGLVLGAGKGIWHFIVGGS